MQKQDPIDYIQEALEEYGASGIKQYNSEIRCRCPFHNGSNRNAFKVNFRKTKPFYYCHSCREAGDLADLIVFLTKSSYKKARRLLENRTTIGVCDVSSLQKKVEKLKELAQGNELSEIELPPMADNQDPMYEYLNWRNRKRQHGVLFVDYVINKYGLYYCAEGRYAGRIIMPLQIDGKVVAINDRSVNHDAKAKSLHMKNMAYSGLLHGLPEAIGKPYCILVEGAFDMYQVVCALMTDEKLWKKYGCINMMGCELHDDQLPYLIENFKKVLLLLDHDRAGIKGARNAAFKLTEYVAVKNVVKGIMRGKDPAVCTPEQIFEAIRYKEKEEGVIGGMKKWILK